MRSSIHVEALRVELRKRDGSPLAAATRAADCELELAGNGLPRLGSAFDDIPELASHLFGGAFEAPVEREGGNGGGGLVRLAEGRVAAQQTHHARLAGALVALHKHTQSVLRSQ